jgi:hypothetical protein
MIDAALDPNNHDLIITNGDIALAVDGAEMAQTIKTRLLTLSAEWILDVGIGVRYQDKIFNPVTTDEERALIIKREILNVNGVQKITRFEFSSDLITRTWTAAFGAITDYGEIFLEVRQ